VFLDVDAVPLPFHGEPWRRGCPITMPNLLAEYLLRTDAAKITGMFFDEIDAFLCA